MTKIDAKKFIECWKEFSEKKLVVEKDWKKKYEDDDEWTSLLLGGKKSSGEDSPIGNFYREKFDLLRYRKEDNKIDLVFSFAKNFKSILYLKEKPNEFYPSNYDVVIEVENNIYTSWQEISKLTGILCRLKVLVTYKEENGDEQTQILKETFQAMIRQVNEHFAENDSTEYLLLVGCIEENELIWKPFIFNTKGEVK